MLNVVPDLPSATIIPIRPHRVDRPWRDEAPQGAKAAVMLVIDGEARCWTSPAAFRTAITDELLAELTAQAEAAIAKAERQQARVAAEIAQIRAGLTRLSRRSLLTRIKRIRALRARRAVALAKAGLTLIAVAGWTAAIITWALEQAA